MHGTVLGQGRLKGFANKRTGSTKKVIAIVCSSNYFHEEDMEIQINTKNLKSYGLVYFTITFPVIHG